ncbi:MAG: aspartate carbamoyltransferase catalytic subunit, partial [Xanthomonadales bacterium]|nr:aspartate carbamoyltransferase catalytic subunit [Xanthomonadales bacterium]
QGQFIPSAREYHHLYGLTKKRLDRAAPDALVMHPGPMNRGVEIDSEVADMLDRSIITRQVEMGVAVRMACLEILTRRARGVEGWGEVA